MENSKELKKQTLNKDFINFIKTKKAKLSSDPVNYEDEEKQNPFKKLKESKKKILQEDNDGALKSILSKHKGEIIDKRLPENEKKELSSSEEDESSESEEEDYDQENYNHFVHDPDSESERSFERERQNMKNKYDNEDYSGDDEDEEDEDDEGDEEAEEILKVDKKEKKVKKNKSEEEKIVEKVLNEKNIKKEKINLVKNKESDTVFNNHCEIYVDNLPFNRNEIDIKKFFAQYNKNIVFVKLLKDDLDKSKGRAFVKFISYNDALSIVNEGEISMDNRRLRVSLVDKERKPNNNSEQNNSEPKNFEKKNNQKNFEPNKFKKNNTDLELNSDRKFNENPIKRNEQVNYQNNRNNTVYVKNLPDVVEEFKLKKLFKKFGNVTNVRLLKNADGLVKSFGYIDFDSAQAAEECIKVGKIKLHEKDLIMERAKSSFNQNVYNDSKTLAKKRRRDENEKYEKQRKEEKQNIE